MAGIDRTSRASFLGAAIQPCVMPPLARIELDRSLVGKFFDFARNGTDKRTNGGYGLYGTETVNGNNDHLKGSGLCVITMAGIDRTSRASIL